jgi:hypothetical protein
VVDSESNALRADHQTLYLMRWNSRHERAGLIGRAEVGGGGAPLRLFRLITETQPEANVLSNAAGLLWHWVLVPIESTDTSVSEAFRAARTTPPDKWISIVEDRRGNEPKLTAAELRAEHSIPSQVFRD